MPSVFSLFGELRADTSQFQNSLKAADALLNKTSQSVDRHAQGAINLGKTTAVTARSYEKLIEKLDGARERMLSTSRAFERGDATAKQMASALNAVDKAAGNVNSKLLDSSARLVDWKQKVEAASGASKGFGLEFFAGLGNIVTGLSNATQMISNFISSVYDGSKALFSFVKSASDFGSEIKDFQDKTGLGAEAITTIKFAAEQTGKSLESLSAPIGKFSKLLGEAADGSDKASAVLEKFGLDPRSAVDDLQGSLDKAVKKILEFPEGARQSYAATQLFGRGGAEVVGVLKGMEGGLDATIRRARELGITLTEEDVKAADNFGDTLGLLGTQVKVLGSRFALQFAPDVTRAMDEVSATLAANQSDIRAWGNRIEEAVSGGIAWFGKLSDAVSGYYALQDKLAADHPWLFARTPGGGQGFTGLGTTQGGNIAEQLIQAGKERNRLLPLHAPASGATFGPKFSSLAGSDEMKKYFDDLEKGSDRANSSTKKLKDTVADLNKMWTSSSLAQFVKAQGFIPGAGFETGGHNAKSLHYVNRALDVGLNTNQRSVDQIVDLMVKSIQAGIRVVDERVRPKPGAVWKGAHIHLEENDTRPSFFNPSLDFGGKLDLLKALDAERIAGKGKSITSTLRSITEEAIRLKEQGVQNLADGFKTLDDSFRSLLDIPKTEFEKLNDTLAGPNVQKALDTMNPKVRSLYELLLNIAAVNKDIGARLGDFGAQGTFIGNPNGTGSQPYDEQGNPILPTQTDTTVPPPPQKSWEDFWGMMNQRLLEWRSSLPTIKTAIGENLIGSIQGIGDILANAAQRWNGTAQGFFLSVADGFKQMGQQIIGDLIRIAFQALITRALTAAFGGIGGGGSGAGLAGGSDFGNLAGNLGTSFFAEGGFPRLNKLAIVGERGPELFVPTVPGRVFSNSDTKEMLNQQPTVIHNTFNFHANQNGQFAKESADQAIKKMIAAQNRTARKDNGF